MRIVFAIVVLAAAIGVAEAKSGAAKREYKRGYADCAAGRYDRAQHGASYKKGCRAAEDKFGPVGDAKVPGTNFHAMGDLPCAIGAGAPMASCEFGVVRRGGGSATVTITQPGGGKRDIVFDRGKAISSDGQGAVAAERTDDVNRVSIGGAERYEIRDVILFGD